MDGGVLLYVTAFPKSRRNEVAGVRNGRLMVKVTAPPEDGKANGAIAKMLAKPLGVASGMIEVVNGHTSREKTLHIAQLSLAEAAEALNL